MLWSGTEKPVTKVWWKLDCISMASRSAKCNGHFYENISLLNKYPLLIKMGIHNVRASKAARQWEKCEPLALGTWKHARHKYLFTVHLSRSFRLRSVFAAVSSCYIVLSVGLGQATNDICWRGGVGSFNFCLHVVVDFVPSYILMSGSHVFYASRVWLACLTLCLAASHVVCTHLQ